MQKGKRTKLFDKFKTDLENAEKNALSQMRSKSYIQIDERFDTVKKLDTSFKQTMIERAKLLDSSVSLISFNFEEKKKTFTQEEATRFKQWE